MRYWLQLTFQYFGQIPIFTAQVVFTGASIADSVIFEGKNGKAYSTILPIKTKDTMAEPNRPLGGLISRCKGLLCNRSDENHSTNVNRAWKSHPITTIKVHTIFKGLWTLQKEVPCNKPEQSFWQAAAYALVDPGHPRITQTVIHLNSCHARLSSHLP